MPFIVLCLIILIIYSCSPHSLYRRDCVVQEDIGGTWVCIDHKGNRNGNY